VRRINNIKGDVIMKNILFTLLLLPILAIGGTPRQTALDKIGASCAGNLPTNHQNPITKLHLYCKASVLTWVTESQGSIEVPAFGKVSSAVATDKVDLTVLEAWKGKDERSVSMLCETLAQVSAKKSGSFELTCDDFTSIETEEKLNELCVELLKEFPNEEDPKPTGLTKSSCGPTTQPVPPCHRSCRHWPRHRHCDDGGDGDSTDGGHTQW